MLLYGLDIEPSEHIELGIEPVLEFGFQLLLAGVLQRLGKSIVA
jgi:hypothetical protein